MARTLPILCIVCLATSSACVEPAQDRPNPTVKEAREEYLARTTAYLRFLEDREEKKWELRQKRVASDDEVDFYRFQVAVARSSLAQLQGDEEKVKKQFRAAVSVREAQRERLKQLRDRQGGFAAEIDVADRQLAAARFRLSYLEGDNAEAIRQLKEISEIAEKEVKRERGLLVRDAATHTEVEDAGYRLAKARFLLAKLKGEKDEGLQLLRDLAALTDSEVKRLQKLETRGASSAEGMEWARFRDLYAKIRLAAAEGKPEQVRDTQQKLADLTAQMLRRALRSTHGTEEEKEYMKWENARQQWALAEIQNGAMLDYESIWELDGWTHIPYQPRG
jgi:hypothetical protein